MSRVNVGRAETTGPLITVNLYGRQRHVAHLILNDIPSVSST